MRRSTDTMSSLIPDLFGSWFCTVRVQLSEEESKDDAEAEAAQAFAHSRSCQVWTPTFCLLYFLIHLRLDSEALQEEEDRQDQARWERWRADIRNKQLQKDDNLKNLVQAAHGSRTHLRSVDRARRSRLQERAFSSSPLSLISACGQTAPTNVIIIIIHLLFTSLVLSAPDLSLSLFLSGFLSCSRSFSPCLRLLSLSCFSVSPLCLLRSARGSKEGEEARAGTGKHSASESGQNQTAAERRHFEENGAGCSSGSRQHAFSCSCKA